MTIKVYRVASDGTRRTLHDEQEVPPADSVPATHGFPPCSCPRCRHVAAR
ncbi:hypothetical protein ACPCSC_28685 [Streptomyces lavendulocolor]